MESYIENAVYSMEHDFEPCDLDGFDLEHIEMLIQEADEKFTLVCQKLVLMNNNIRQVHTRYVRASHHGRRSFRYNLRMRLLTMEYVRDMFHVYAMRLAERIDLLEAKRAFPTEEEMEMEEDLEEDQDEGMDM